jgi:hypothetical protein
MKKLFLAKSSFGHDATILPPSDLLRGAKAIARFLLDDSGPRERRVVYHLFEKGTLPAFRLGSRIYARKSTLSAWIERLEAANDALWEDTNKPAAQ